MAWPMAQPVAARTLRTLGWLALASLAIPAASASTPDVWTGHPYTPMAGTGCVKTTWHNDAIYAVRTPSCSLAAGQDVTFERYTPATGATTIIAHLPWASAEAGVEAIGGKLYIFTPAHPGIPAVTVQRYDPATGLLKGLASYFPGCTLNAPSFVDGNTITWTSNCVWSCEFIRYDAATDTWTTLQAKLPGEPGDLAKLGLIWDGTVAHILTYDYDTHVARFYDYNPASPAPHGVTPGAVATISNTAGPLLQTGPGTAVISTWASSLTIQMSSYDLAANAWTKEPGLVAGVNGGPALWGPDVSWIIGTSSGSVLCIARIAECPQADPNPPPNPEPDPDPIIIVDPIYEEPRQPPATRHSSSVAEPDGDHDGIPDSADNCPNYANRDQTDRDQDGVGNACDDDMDGDGVSNLAPDNCPLAFNPDQADKEGDGIGDSCQPPADLALYVANKDSQAIDQDLDGIPDTSDNCPAIKNPVQEDLDRDGMGNVCDTDRDGDGIVQVSALAGAYLDNCPDTPNADQVDGNNNNLGDACNPLGVQTFVAPAVVPPLAGNSVAQPPGPSIWSPAMIAGLGMAGVAAVGGIWATNKKWLPFLAPLFSRFVGRDVSIHPARARLLAAIEAQPGIHFNELARLAGQARGSVRHHLQVLETAGLVRLVRSGRYTCLYLADVPSEPGAGIRKSEVARRLESMVRDHPGMTAADASRSLGVTYGATAYHLRRMADAGLVRLEDKPLAAYPLVVQH